MSDRTVLGGSFEELAAPTLIFTFRSPAKVYSLGRRNGLPFLRIVLWDVPPRTLPERHRVLFSRQTAITDGQERVAYVFSHGATLESVRLGSDGRRPYRVDTPRAFTPLPHVRHVDLATLAPMLKVKTTLFYTGAGLSTAAGIPNLNELTEALGIDFSMPLDPFFERALCAPQQVIQPWMEFLRVADEAEPTPAHLALTSLARSLDARILTENVDVLHEKSGVRAAHLSRVKLDEWWPDGIKTVVTLGLRSDERGVLGWYKRRQPSGTIVALNLEQPSYLDQNDVLLKCDVQTAVPELVRLTRQVARADSGDRDHYSARS